MTKPRPYSLDADYQPEDPLPEYDPRRYAMKEERKPCVPIPAGVLFTITTGEYSDYSIHGVFRAKAEIDTDALFAKWFEDHPTQKNSYAFSEHDFIASLTHLLEPIECWEFHLDDYGNPLSHTVEQMDNRHVE